MPDELGAQADPRTTDDLLSKMLGWFELPQAPNGPRVPSLSTQGNARPAPPPPTVPPSPHRTWGGYPPVDPEVLLKAYEDARKKHGSYGRL